QIGVTTETAPTLEADVDIADADYDYEDRFFSDNGNYTDYYTGTKMVLKASTCNIDLYPNGGTNPAGRDTTITVVKGSQYTLPAADYFTAPENKIFAGWKVGEGATMAAGAEITVTVTVPVYAQWTDSGNRNIFFDANGGTGTMTSQTVALNSDYTLPECGFTEPAGKQFAGWKVGDSDGVNQPGDIITVSENTTVTAIWEYIPITIEPSTDYMRGKGTVTLTVDPYDVDAGLGVTCDDSSITVTDNHDGTYSAYLPNRTQSYTFTAKYSGDTLDTVTVDCTVDVRKKSSSSSDSSSGGSSNEKPAEKPEEKPEVKPEEKPEEVSKNNEIVLTIGEKVAVVFGDPVVNDVAPVVRSDRTMLPIRFVVEALGGTVTWNQAQQSVTCVKGDNTITIYVGHPFALVNGNPVELDSPAFIENDRTYLPIRFVAENLDATVTWNADTQEVTVVPDK
ncbi:MAG: copper amine oxidase N-terminal domain-containing protein, partial [Anaerotignum sp.]